jgi:hypothetical protein
MKTMKLLRVVAIVYMLLTASAAFASPADDLARIAALSAELSTNGIAGMLDLATRNGLRAPWMPDQWHVENVVKEAERVDVANAGRNFGTDLTKRLDEVSGILHRPAPSEVYQNRSTELCELAEWVGQPEAVGNLMLTGRCLDLAAVGVARLVANTNYPLEQCEAILERLDGLLPQIAPPRRARILDAEADAELFSKCRTDKDLQQVWEAGVRRYLRARLLRSQAGGAKFPDGLFAGSALVSDSLLERRKSFFAIYESPNPETDHNRNRKDNPYQRVVNGVGGRSIVKARALLEFRKFVGFFPEPWVRSEEEWKRLKEEIAEGAKWGRKITPIEESPSFNPWEEAFRQAWHEKVKDTKRCNEYVWAYEAYKEIMEEWAK